jgi:hypothetical protein
VVTCSPRIHCGSAVAHAVENLAHAWIVEAESILEAADARVGEMAG